MGGASLGGSIALEIARQIRAQGGEVALLVMFDHAPRLARDNGSLKDSLLRVWRWARNIPAWLRESGSLGWRRLLGRARWRLSVGIRRFTARLETDTSGEPTSGDLLDFGDEIPAYRQALIEAHWRAIHAYRPEPYSGDVLLLQAAAQPLLSLSPPDLGWEKLASGNLITEVVPGTHEGMFTDPHVSILAGVLNKHLSEYVS